MIWITVINFALILFLDIDPLYKLIWFFSLWIIDMFLVSKIYKNMD